MEIRVVDRLYGGKLVEGRLTPSIPKIDELEGDVVFKYKGDDIFEFKEDKPDEGLGGSIDSILAQWAGDKTWLQIPNGWRPWNVQDSLWGGAMILRF